MAGLAVGPQGAPMEPGATPPQAQPGAAPAPAPPQGDAAQGTPATPEEQALYNRVVAMAMLAIYDDKMAPKLADRLKKAPDVVEMIGEISATMAMRVYTELKSSQPVPGDVMMHAGKEIVETVGELAEAVQVEVSADDLERAFYHALDKFRSMAQQSGDYGEEQATEDAAALREMDQSGAFNQILASLQQEQNGGAV